MIRVLGLGALLLGSAIIVWIGYNFLVAMQPEAKGRSPVLPTLAALVMIYQGQKWLRGK